MMKQDTKLATKVAGLAKKGNPKSLGNQSIGLALRDQILASLTLNDWLSSYLALTLAS